MFLVGRRQQNTQINSIINIVYGSVTLVQTHVWFPPAVCLAACVLLTYFSAWERSASSVCVSLCVAFCSILLGTSHLTVQAGLDQWVTFATHCYATAPSFGTAHKETSMSSSSSSLVLQPITLLDRPNYAFPACILRGFSTIVSLWDFKFSRRRVWSYTAVYNNCRPTFQRYVLPPSSGNQHVPLKPRPTIILHGSTSQKTILILIVYFMGWGCRSHAQPPLEGLGCLFLSGTSPSTCPAWETLPVATLPPA
jgi:hypothetical protein